jgi:hypothetical protein
VDDCIAEAEWLASTDIEMMLDSLSETASNRKLRLFGVACCRRIWNLLHDVRSKKAVEYSELFADGEIDKVQLLAARKEAEQAWLRMLSRRSWTQHAKRELKSHYAAEAVRFAASATGNAAVLFRRMRLAAKASAAAESQQRGASPFQTQLQRCNLLRDIFGNPFRPVMIDAAWLTSAVVDIAEAIYNDRAFDRLPELADALVVADCDGRDILDHCRSEGPHVRGCWVVDLVIGKK